MGIFINIMFGIWCGFVIGMVIIAIRDLIRHIRHRSKRRETIKTLIGNRRKANDFQWKNEEKREVYELDDYDEGLVFDMYKWIKKNLSFRDGIINKKLIEIYKRIDNIEEKNRKKK